MASANDTELHPIRVTVGTPIDEQESPLELCTPQDCGPQDSSQVTLPSTEIPQSPIDPNQSFKTENNDDRPAVTVIPSSLTPPPSTQANNHIGRSRGTFTNSQQSNLFSPPATVLNNLRERERPSEFAPPAPHLVVEASTEELRAMLQACIAENQKLKMETAHHKLQYNLLSLQADDDSKRAAVEHDMIRREVDALRGAEHTRQARRELSTSSESTQAKYLHMKMQYEAVVEEAEILQRRVKVAKRLIQQKDEETMILTEERDMLLTRIRENREHVKLLCSPGGIFHGALTPKPHTVASPQRYRTTSRQTSKLSQAREGEHGLSALLQAMSQDNNSAPSTPLTVSRAAARPVGKHYRNAQSMSSLPTTPMSRPRGEHVGLLPSVDLVPHTEPQRNSQKQYGPTTPVSRSENHRRKSRESTISVDDNEELARQALESVAAAQSFTSYGGRPRQQDEEEEVFDSQASQAATEMLRRDPRQSFEVASSGGSQDDTLGPVEKSAKMQAKLFSNHKGDYDKRKFSASHNSMPTEVRRDQGSPAKKMRVAANPRIDGRRAGLGIHVANEYGIGGPH